MEKIERIGTISKKQLQKIERKLSREEELDLDRSKGFKSNNSIHKSDKNYSRKNKHKGDSF